MSSPHFAQVFHQLARVVGNGLVLKALPCVGNFSATSMPGTQFRHCQECFERDSGSPPDSGMACDVAAMVVSHFSSDVVPLATVSGSYELLPDSSCCCEEALLVVRVVLRTTS